MLHDVSFMAATGDLMDAQGNLIPADIGRLLYRTDDNTPLAVVGPRYQPIQHMDVLDPVLQTMKDQGYDIHERQPDLHSLYDLKGSRGAFVGAQVAANGAVMKATIITGDFIDPVPKMFRGPNEQDTPPTMFREYVILNSHDSSLAARVDPGWKVLSCMNGMRSSVFTAHMRSKHTKGFNVEAFKRQVLAAATLMETDADRFRLYATTKLSREGAEQFLKKTFCRLPDENGEAAWSERTLKVVLERFDKHEAQTVWGLHQAMTWYATHGDVRGGGEGLMARLRRDEQVAQSMRSPYAEKLLAA
jgi:Domain of unknown function (DUF932)